MPDGTERGGLPTLNGATRRRTALAVAAYLGTSYVVLAMVVAASELAESATRPGGLGELLMEIGSWRVGFKLWGVAFGALIVTFGGIGPVLYHVRVYRGHWRGLLVRSVAHGLAAVAAAGLIGALCFVVPWAGIEQAALALCLLGTCGASAAVLWLCQRPRRRQ